MLQKTNILRKTPITLALSLAWGITPMAVMAQSAPATGMPPSSAAAPSSDKNEQPAGSAAEATLPAVTVKADAESGYRATMTRVGKVLQDPQDIPQAVTTITHTILEEQQVGSLREALRNVSGLTFNAAEGGRSGDNMMLRSFYTFGDMYLDGIRDTAQYNRETFNLEQVDVLRGSAAMLFGRGQAGGVINQVSKTPLLIKSNTVTVSGGTNDYREITGDINNPLSDTSAVRVNVMKRDEGSWRSNPTTSTQPLIDRAGAAISIGQGLGTDKELILSHLLTTANDIPDYGISFDPATREPSKRFPASYFWGTEKNFDESNTNITTGAYTYRFAEGEWRTQLRHADYKRSYWAKTPNLTNPPDPQAVNGGNQTRAMDYETITLQSDYSTQVREHELLAGVEYLIEDSFRKGLQNFGGTTSGNPPDYRPYQVATAGTATTFKSDSYAVYAQDTVEFRPQWKATVGARRDQMDARYSSTTSPRLMYGQWSYRAALSWQPAKETHYYMGYSDSFSPTADLYQLTVTPLPPERSQVLEIGLKKLYFDGALAFRTALYRATKEWERNTDLESTAAILTKKRRTDGLEFEVTGRLTNNWEVFSGLALMNAKILEVAENVNAATGVVTPANSGYAGQRPPNTPVYTFNLWSTYNLGGGWKAGGGIEAKGDRYGFNPSGTGPIPTLGSNTDFHPNTAPAYVRLDAMASYEEKKYSVRLNVQNLLNKLYYDAIYVNGGFTVPGTNRKIILTLESKF